MFDDAADLIDDAYDADLIHSYSRRRAIEGGVLIDVTAAAREAGIKFRFTLTAVAVPPGVACQDEASRLWDVLRMFLMAARNASGPTLFYGVHVEEGPPRRQPARRAAAGAAQGGVRAGRRRRAGRYDHAPEED